LEKIAMRIAVLTGGGDCPGLNGAIKLDPRDKLLLDDISFLDDPLVR
jgi:hypothetical protein